MRPDIAELARRFDLEPELLAAIQALMENQQSTLVLTQDWADSGEPALGIALESQTDRYSDLGLIARGGMGEVRRVRDTHLDRVLAMKIIHPSLLTSSHAMARFAAEARATARLQHPGIVPVHDVGRLPDGRLWFTMKEVDGRTLREVILEVHGRDPDAVGHAGGWTLRRLVAAFLQLCHAVAYANEHGVVHRDLKPSNAMIGRHGEVYVVDWGVAKLLEGGEALEQGGCDPTDDSSNTHAGQIVGTPAYMSPEQARGARDQVDARSDVYSLGAMLYEVLVGVCPLEGPTQQVLQRLLHGPMVQVPAYSASGVRLPPELAAVCRRAMAMDPSERFSTASALAEEVSAWLDGSRRRDQAMALAVHARASVPRAEALAMEAAQLHAQAEDLLSAVPLWAPETQKHPGWALLDQARETRIRARMEALRGEQGLVGALMVDPTLLEAHEALLAGDRKRFAEAEARRDVEGMAEARILLEARAERFAEEHPSRVELVRFLKGDGVLSVATEPPGAEVSIRPYVLEHRRLSLGEERVLGTSPLRVPMAMGSYVCVIRGEGRQDVSYPVQVPRCGEWHGVRPGDQAPSAVWLPPAGWLGDDEQYVPAGWFQAGGDRECNGVPAGARWCDAFVMQRDPVTNAEYLQFLNDLVAQGRTEDAVRFVPRERGAADRAQDGWNYALRDGRFVLMADMEGDLWLPDWPVFNVDWFMAKAFHAWRAEQTGRPWRLPTEAEWEKAARGVDGRWYPWGDALDPSWCCMGTSHQGRRGPTSVGAYPVDVSPYGVRGLAGNVSDWCEDPFDPLRADGVVDAFALRSVRGGTWAANARFARSADRHGHFPQTRSPGTGFRGVYSVFCD